ncbi:MAG: 50S ribosome-binding GTPase [Candidatus Saccharibacteria bacterium]|nr:50S ribosome-binding GTPase [Candidatus Saccharibacteria bacterium]
MSMPIVALIGQTNAGKSTLLNRFARKNLAITAREAGTTRDNVFAKIDNSFLLVDTAGLLDPRDDFEASIQDQISDAISSAHLILVVLDSTKYPNQKDLTIARNALKSKKPVFLILNKTDLGDALPNSEFRKFGIKEDHIFRVSATTGQSILDLKSAITSTLNLSRQKPSTEKSPLKISLIGRPNVGKSSLFNTLGKKQQAIVSSRQGTTRDINRLELKYKGQPLEILDTAGLRKPGRREVGIEKFSALRTLSAIEESDVCALLIDGTEPHAKLDQALAGEIIKAGKGIILVITKSDLINKTASDNLDNSATEFITLEPSITEQHDSATESARTKTPTDEILDRLERDFNFLPFAPVLITSSETGKNVTKLFELAFTINESRHHEIPTADLNRILQDSIHRHPPAGLKNTHPKPKYIVQTDTCPPWFVIHGHDLGLLHWSYKRYLERKIREFYPYIGTPIFFSFRSDS